MGPAPCPPPAPRGAGRARARPRPVLARNLPAGPPGRPSWQALLARLLAGCDIEALDGTQARAAGTLAARAATTDITGACASSKAPRRRDLVISSDEGDLQAITAAIGHHLHTDHP